MVGAAAVAVMAWILLKYKYIKPKSEIFSKIRLNFQNRNEQYYIRTILTTIIGSGMKETDIQGTY